MDENPPLTLRRSLRLLRRLWWLPATTFAIGLVLGLVTLGGGRSTAQANVVLVRTASADLLSQLRQPTATDIGPPVNALASVLRAAAQNRGSEPALAGTHLGVEADASTSTLTLRVTAPDDSRASRALAVYLEVLDAERERELRRYADTVLAAADARQAVLDAYLRDPAGGASGSDVVVVDRADAVRQLADVAAVRKAAEELRDTEAGSGAVVSLTTVEGGLGLATAVAVAIALLLLGIALVLLLGPLDPRLHDREDVELRAAPAGVVEAGMDPARLWPATLAVQRHGEDHGRVAVVPAGQADAGNVADAIRAQLGEIGSDVEIVAAPPLAGGMAALAAHEPGPTLVVVRRGRDRKSDLAHALRTLRAAGREPVAVALLGAR